MNNLDPYLPKMKELELAQAVHACRAAGASKPANALSKHISRLSIELELTQKALVWVVRTFIREGAIIDPAYTPAINEALERQSVPQSGSDK